MSISLLLHPGWLFLQDIGFKIKGGTPGSAVASFRFATSGLHVTADVLLGSGSNVIVSVIECVNNDQIVFRLSRSHILLIR